MNLYTVLRIKEAEVFKVSPNAQYFCIGGINNSRALKLYADSLWISEYHAPEKYRRRVRKKLTMPSMYNYYMSIEDLLADNPDPLPVEGECEGWIRIYNGRLNYEYPTYPVYLRLKIPAEARRTSWVYKTHKHRCDMAQVIEIRSLPYSPDCFHYLYESVEIFYAGRDPIKVSVNDMIYAADYDPDRTCSYESGIIFYSLTDSPKYRFPPVTLNIKESSK